MMFRWEMMFRLLLALTFTLVACGDDVSSGSDAGGDTSSDAAGDNGGDGGDTCSLDPDCSDSVFCNGIERCDPDNPAADARGCTAATPPCPSSLVCNEVIDICVAACETPDADMDGVASIACGGLDCDDDDSNAYPGNVEICDRADHDEDCNPATMGVQDLDNDGFTDAAC